MINDNATAKGTRSRAERFSHLDYRPLGDTGLLVSPAGFGGYRVTDHFTPHAEALRHALVSGINLIDTSANYADGGSETLIGRVLDELISAQKIRRSHVVVISKVGYLQGQNLALSRQREARQGGFKDLVSYAEGLAHCIHPEFVQDQLTRSLERLGLSRLDGYLLHNPEYYLSWAHRMGTSIDQARTEYDRRIRMAFAHLEKEVAAGRIRFYGVSSNTLPDSGDAANHTSLTRLCEAARSVSADHHFRVIQFPMNLLETGAATRDLSGDDRSLLDMAQAEKLAVLINRPLNAMAGRQIIRLADIDVGPRQDYNDIIRAIRAVGRSEKRLWRRILPGLDIPSGLVARIKEQVAISDQLTHYWRSFGSWDRWCQARDAALMPRVQGVTGFLAPYAEDHDGVAEWITAHVALLDAALVAVGSIYAEAAARRAERISQAVAAADPQWGEAPTLSQRAVRALRATAGVSTVLVGMRRCRYVDDVLAELQRPIAPSDRQAGWQAMARFNIKSPRTGYRQRRASPL